MRQEPPAGGGGGSRRAQAAADVAANRRRAEELQHAAGAAKDRSRALGAALDVRRDGAASFRDQMEVWEETRRTLREMASAARELTAEREAAEREVAEQTAWVRGQVDAMLGSGWTREELRDIGIADEVLEQVGLLDDPRLRENRAQPGTARS